MERTISLAEHVEEIRLVDSPRGDLLRRVASRLRALVGKPEPAPRLLVTDERLLVAEPGRDERIEIPWGALRKAAVDDGSSWGYVSGVGRFPVYDLRADGSGSGVLIGPLWSHGSSLLPAECPVEGVDPVPRQAPNLALILEPRLVGAASRHNGGGRRESDSIALLLLRVQHPAMAREVLAARDKLGAVDRDDLEYLGRAAGESRPERQAPGAGAAASA